MKNELSKTQAKKMKETLTKSLEVAENAHARAFTGHVNEGNYKDSCQKIKMIYQQLEEVSNLLGEPIPVRF